MTPLMRDSDGLPLRLADFETLWEGLDYAAQGAKGISFFDSLGRLTGILSYRELRDRAVDLALRLNANGFRHGDRLAIVAETTPDFPVFFFGCQYAGVIPVPLPMNVHLGAHDAYIVSLRNMMKAAGVRGVVASDDWIAQVREAASMLEIPFAGPPEDFYALSRKKGNLAPFGKDDPCYIQYSSGSTAFPKGVLGTQLSVTSNARGIGGHALQVRDGDHAVSWLPLYHDMGLVGFCITPMLTQLSLDYLSASSFARRPLVWLTLMSERRGTISFSPTFGYDLCVRKMERRGIEEADLSPWRIAGIGGEMIRPAVLAKFAEVFGPFGFDEKAFLPSYGLAESTLAVTFSGLGRGVRTHRRSELAPDQRDANYSGLHREFAICGKPMPDHELEVRADDGTRCAEGEIGRVFAKGPSVMAGYFGEAEASAEVLGDDGWLDTGDLGYLLDGELVISGRGKDLIIQNGRNIWPQDIEWAVEQLEGVKGSGVAAVSMPSRDGSENVVVVVEARVKAAEEIALLEKQIHSAVYQAAGLKSEVVITTPRSLVRTSSGKLSRAGTLTKLLSGQIAVLNRYDEDAGGSAKRTALAS